MATHKTPEEITQAMDKILHDVRLEKSHPSNEVRFGHYLRTALAQASIELSQLASLLGIDDELVDAILDGVLPASELDDQLLQAVADALQEDVSVLHIFLGRTVSAESSGTNAGAAARKGSRSK
ncbi:MAG: hypothetical protein R3E39_07995 [Anaerolineae bacterium]